MAGTKGKRRSKTVPEGPSPDKAEPDIGQLTDRRREVREWWVASTSAAARPVGPDCSPASAGSGDGEAPQNPSQPVRPKDVVGLALSGGGIRSATFSLGLLQALAKVPRDAFSKIDIISSVSGGGYISCFVRSLFMPGAARGIVPKAKAGAAAISNPALALTQANVEKQYQFARDVLESSANDRDILWPRGQTTQRHRNPLWWLREHSRYLAPNGPTDYGYAIAYLTRNWLAMLYIFLLAVVCLFTAGIGIEAVALSPSATEGLGASRQLQWLRELYAAQGVLAKLSPIVLFAPVPLLISASLMISYWMTQGMSPNEPDLKRQRGNLLVSSVSALVVIGVIAAVLRWVTPDVLQPVGQGGSARLISAFLVLGVGVITAGAVFAILSGLLLVKEGTRLTAELRRRLTERVAVSNRWLMIILLAALIDSLGAALARVIHDGFELGLGPIFSTALVPALAVFMNKLTTWLGGRSSTSWFTLLTRFADKAALVVGSVLFASLAIVAAALVHLALWKAHPWSSDLDVANALFFTLVVVGLGLLAAMADGFINLSSLHTYYASRLTRAYLGATNMRRLIIISNPNPGFSIRDNASGDYIQPQIYSQADLPAPIHIINATINETLDPSSQLVARDRKGHLLSLEPGGVRVADEMVDWKNLGGDCAEQISLGQWCAISGAAASSGMGRLTNLGFALALTFANVRLGYWWWSPGVCRSGGNRSAFDRSSILGPFLYLFNEMTARYSRLYQRKYLTDGGHFENTGAFRLIEQRVPLIIVSDNGADPKFQFADLENLTRKVRLDLGGELEILCGKDLAAFANRFGCNDPSVFIDGAASDWRERLALPSYPGFVVGLRARFRTETLDVVWIKPRLMPGLPPDLAGYSLVNPAFPQQSTGDQFFDEAQWESYRRLGEFGMRRLLDACPNLLP
jgi:hypothetical protein